MRNEMTRYVVHGCTVLVLRVMHSVNGKVFRALPQCLMWDGCTLRAVLRTNQVPVTRFGTGMPDV